MILRGRIGNVAVISNNKIPTKLPMMLGKAELVMLFDDNVRGIPKRMNSLTEEAKDVKFFMDNNECYLTNLVFDQQLLSEPIRIIAFFQSNVLVYWKNHCLKLDKGNLHNDYKQDVVAETLFSGNTWEESTRPTAPKRKRSYGDRHLLQSDAPSSSVSTELGLLTMTADSSTTVLSYSDDNLCVLQPVQIADNETQEMTNSTQQIVPSKLDNKTMHQRTLASCNAKIKELLNTDLVTGTPSVLPTHRVTCRKQYEATDTGVLELIAKVKKNQMVPDMDPIVVVERGGNYEVLSGSRRVAACKTANLGELRAFRLLPEEQRSFLLKKFVHSQSKEGDTRASIEFVDELITFAECDRKTMTKWTGKELLSVFQQALGTSLKMLFLLHICMHPALKDAIIRVCNSKTDLSSNVLRDIYRKFLQNPKEVLQVLEDDFPETINDREIHKKLRNIQPDLFHSLVKKSVSSSVAGDLVEHFQNDADFLHFARRGDLRLLNKMDEKNAILKRFETFKTKIVHNSTPSFHAVYEKELIKLDLIMTSAEDSVRKLLQTEDHVTVFLIGAHIDSGSMHTIILPDALSSYDNENKIFYNHVSLTICMKRQGRMLMSQREISEQCLDMGLMRKSVFAFKDLLSLFNSTSKTLVEFGGALSKDFFSQLEPKGTVAVRTQSDWEILNSLVQESRPTQSVTMDTGDN